MDKIMKEALYLLRKKKVDELVTYANDMSAFVDPYTFESRVKEYMNEIREIDAKVNPK